MQNAAYQVNFVDTVPNCSVIAESILILGLETRKRRRMAKNNVKTDKFEQILEAGVRVFAEQGYHGSTVSAIAREAGVADGTIYLYFKNKEDILARFVRSQSQRFFETFRDKMPEKGSAVDRLKLLVKLHFEVSQENMHKALVYQVEMRRSTSLMKGDIREALKTYHEIVGAILEEGQQEGAIRQDIYVGMIKRVIFASVDEAITTWVMSGGKYDLVPLAEPLVDFFLNGISTKSARA